MQTSLLGLSFIKRNEGFSSAPYEDNGHTAWGYGHDQQPGETVPDSITQDAAGFLLREDVTSHIEPALNQWLTNKGIVATQNQFDALIDFAYNLGTNALLTMLGHGWDQVPQQIPRWNNVNHQPNAGLTARRAAEVELFTTPEAV